MRPGTESVRKEKKKNLCVLKFVFKRCYLKMPVKKKKKDENISEMFYIWKLIR